MMVGILITASCRPASQRALHMPYEAFTACGLCQTFCLLRLLNVKTPPKT